MVSQFLWVKINLVSITAFNDRNIAELCIYNNNTNSSKCGRNLVEDSKNTL